MIRLRYICHALFSILWLALLLALPAASEAVPPGGPGDGMLAIGGTPATTLSLTVPPDISNWQLTPGSSEANSQICLLKVRADGNWKITAEDQGTATSGHIIDAGYEKQLPLGGGDSCGLGHQWRRGAGGHIKAARLLDGSGSGRGAQI